MSLLLNFLIIIISLAVILITADIAIKKSVEIAKYFNMSDELIGMTILAIGTSMPEIITHIIGSYKILRNPWMINDISWLVIGSNIGSDVFQQNFIIGFIALLGVVLIEKKHLFKDLGGLIGASLILLFLAYDGIISRLDGFLMLSVYLLYLFFLGKYGVVNKKSNQRAKKDNIPKKLLILLATFVIMSFAADKLLNNSAIVVKALPISASFFGVILLGIAAALPELTTSLVALRKNRARISVGILIGSNITNPMFALGLGALISTYTVSQVTILFDLPIKILTAILLLAFLWKGKLRKRDALLLIASYLLYLYLRNVLFPTDILIS